MTTEPTGSPAAQRSLPLLPPPTIRRQLVWRSGPVDDNQSQVTRDDIAKSGLDVITSENLAQYVKDGKVSSSCLERCFICLDKYDAGDDQVRVMRCRHAFHRICVDRWIEKGRNSCPTCRSTGVLTNTPTTP